MSVQNRAAHGDRNGTAFEPFSGLSAEELAEASLLFTFEPEGKPHLKLTLRAIPWLRALPAGSGSELIYRYEISGKDGTNTHSDTRGSIILGTDFEIRHEWVRDALAAGLNPIVEILIQSPEIRNDLTEHSPALGSVIESIELTRLSQSVHSAADPGRG